MAGSPRGPLRAGRARPYPAHRTPWPSSASARRGSAGATAKKDRPLAHNPGAMRAHYRMTPPSAGGETPARPWLRPAVFYVALLAGLLWLYLQAPPGFPEQWAGRDRLPEQSVRVSALYREAAGLPFLPLPAPLYRAAHLALFVAVWPAWALAVRRLAGARSGGAYWDVTAALLLVAALMPPLLSTDVYYYGVTGEIVAAYGENPHLRPPSEFPRSVLLPYNYWRDFPSPYGPAWTSVSAGVVSLAGSSPLAASLAFKLLAALLVAATTILIYRLARGWAPGREAQATALWAWNPLMLLETAANGHNDALLALLLVAGLALLTRGSWPGASVLAALSALVKLTALPALGLLALGRLATSSSRERAGRLIAMACVAGALAVIAYAPYWEGAATLRGLAGQPLGSVHGPVAGTAWAVGTLLGSEAAGLRAGRLASAVGVGLLGAWLVGAAARLWRTREGLELRGEGLLWGVALVLVPVVFVRSYPWYVVPGIALLAAVWPHGRRTTLALLGGSALWLVAQYGV